jgi:hypothetical protein
MTFRMLTLGETALIASVFGQTVRTGLVQVHRRRWWFGQPPNITMAPNGHLWFHPNSPAYCDDFSLSMPRLQAFFLHEITHVWQVQRGTNLVFARGLWSRYSYLPLQPGRYFESYGIEQQAEIVRHFHLLRCGIVVPGAAPIELYKKLLPFLPNVHSDADT